MNIESLTLSRQAMIALAITAAFPATSMAAAGRVEFAIGGAAAISADGVTRSLTKGTEINSGDTIKTTDGRVQVRFTDGGYMSFQPNTEFKIENYSYDGKQDGSEKGFFRLVEGGLRAITGLVGRNNRPAYRVATPVATIGIRGSEYLAEHRDNKLKTRVIGGSIYIENEFGDLILFKGQSSETGKGEEPRYSEEESGVQAKGPEGGNPEDGDNESKDDQEKSNTFAVNDILDDDGQSCALTKTCESILSGNDGVDDQGIDDKGIIAKYAEANAVGYYIGATTALAGLSGGYTGTASGELYAYFGEYKVENYLDVTASSGASPVAASFSGAGSIGTDGGISLPSMTTVSNTGFCGGGGCTVSGSGVFSGASAESANISYEIGNVNVAPGTVTTTVPYSADYIKADGGSGEVLYSTP